MKKTILMILRSFDKAIFATKQERLNTYRVFNRFFNKEVIYNYIEVGR